MLRYPVTATRVQLAGMSMAAHRECEVHAGEASVVWSRPGLASRFQRGGWMLRAYGRSLGSERQAMGHRKGVPESSIAMVGATLGSFCSTTAIERLV